MNMTAIWAIALLGTALAGNDEPRTYLLSLTSLPLQGGDRIKTFSMETWGVTVKAVCQIPSGWFIKAGQSATPDGRLEGEGSLGATWIGSDMISEFNGLALVAVDVPLQREVKGAIPATFKGFAMVDNGDKEHKLALTTDNVELVPANRCPTPNTSN